MFKLINYQLPAIVSIFYIHQNIHYIESGVNLHLFSTVLYVYKKLSSALRWKIAKDETLYYSLNL